jgi:putative phosphoribosyl transferase
MPTSLTDKLEIAEGPAKLERVRVQAGPVSLDGDLSMPPGAASLVIFAHGGGSSRFSPRNRAVAKAFNEAGLATLLMDLLTDREQEIDERTRDLRFDIPLLGERMVGTIDWTKGYRATSSMRIGLFGASTGAAGALLAAAERPTAIGAVVSRGGRPDLAMDVLPRVQAPVLLLVGSYDTLVIRMNEDAAAQLRCQHELKIVTGASHLFEEPGKLETVAQMAAEWFAAHLHCAEAKGLRGY